MRPVQKKCGAQFCQRAVQRDARGVGGHSQQRRNVNGRQFCIQKETHRGALSGRKDVQLGRDGV